MKVYSKILSILIYGIASALGILALAYPFFFPAMVANTPMGMARFGEMPLMLTLLLGLCLVVLLFEAQGQAINTKLVALLGV